MTSLDHVLGLGIPSRVRKPRPRAVWQWPGGAPGFQARSPGQGQGSQRQTRSWVPTEQLETWHILHLCLGPRVSIRNHSTASLVSQLRRMEGLARMGLAMAPTLGPWETLDLFLCHLDSLGGAAVLWPGPDRRGFCQVWGAIVTHTHTDTCACGGEAGTGGRRREPLQGCGSIPGARAWQSAVLARGVWARDQDHQGPPFLSISGIMAQLL